MKKKILLLILSSLFVTTLFAQGRDDYKVIGPTCKVVEGDSPGALASLGVEFDGLPLLFTIAHDFREGSFPVLLLYSEAWPHTPNSKSELLLTLSDGEIFTARWNLNSKSFLVDFIGSKRGLVLDKFALCDIEKITLGTSVWTFPDKLSTRRYFQALKKELRERSRPYGVAYCYNPYWNTYSRVFTHNPHHLFAPTLIDHPAHIFSSRRIPMAAAVEILKDTQGIREVKEPVRYSWSDEAFISITPYEEHFFLAVSGYEALSCQLMQIRYPMGKSNQISSAYYSYRLSDGRKSSELKECVGSLCRDFVESGFVMEEFKQGKRTRGYQCNHNGHTILITYDKKRSKYLPAEIVIQISYDQGSSR